MSTQRIELYSPYERIWHWLQAGAILLLIATGLAIHGPERFGWIDFATAVRLHNVLGFLLIANAFLGLFYYVTTGTIRQYMPEPRDFVSLSVRQARYYLRGMFRGEEHPLERSSRRRLNPLQQVTYLIILNVLLPLQLVTGLLIWGAQTWPATVEAVGGLPILALIHTLGAWIFGAFVLMHVYLTTTGHTPLANLRAMVLGYEEPPPSEDSREGGQPPVPGHSRLAGSAAAGQGHMGATPPVTHGS
jgi:Ni/Fe-hydrogenase b-type cytochrome subunit